MICVPAMWEFNPTLHTPPISIDHEPSFLHFIEASWHGDSPIQYTSLIIAQKIVFSSECEENLVKTGRAVCLLD
jgi:hypothetical protein